MLGHTQLDMAFDREEHLERTLPAGQRKTKFTILVICTLLRLYLASEAQGKDKQKAQRREGESRETEPRCRTNETDEILDKGRERKRDTGGRTSGESASASDESSDRGGDGLWRASETGQCVCNGTRR